MACAEPRWSSGSDVVSACWPPVPFLRSVRHEQHLARYEVGGLSGSATRGGSRGPSRGLRTCGGAGPGIGDPGHVPCHAPRMHLASTALVRQRAARRHEPRRSRPVMRRAGPRGTRGRTPARAPEVPNRAVLRRREAMAPHARVTAEVNREAAGRAPEMDVRWTRVPHRAREHHVEEPRPARSCRAPPELGRAVGAERRHPRADRLVRRLDAALVERLRHAADAQREPLVQPHRVGDQRRLEAVPGAVAEPVRAEERVRSGPNCFPDHRSRRLVVKALLEVPHPAGCRDRAPRQYGGQKCHSRGAPRM
jgi:hypothetical protein